MKTTALIVFVTLVVSGCSLLGAPDVPTTRYFVLTSDRTLDGEFATENTLSLGLGPFTFPSYLDRPQMVTRTDPNQVVYSQFNRWAEPIASGFPRVLSENIGRVTNTSEIATFPWYKVPLEYQVKGEVLRFEANDDGEVVLECIWTVVRLGEKDRYLVIRHADLHHPVDSDNPDEVAQALSRLTSDLAREIGQTLLAEHAVQNR